ncbi:sugar phosphate isomerase/epimerase [Agromyces sp. ISL-38]|uniref:sugar phosphate isomerase/epimerase family protein n=1 Tax=Agromyces sp. ISL-38 TaxID=2819107 RepID=UPI001BEA1D55|nr:sugar phosphate isomerase/epimerase family protein [Agromyces sp. ISL-38]MBT2499088.1 sugar phosphate isomerase/epimerase [Agromyces sp. ISL-38]MBT2518369.1 sugar phosphate isomerase/epimerase [Streptomyces sp. ISL-90]
MTAHPRLSLNQATIKYAPFDEALRLTRAGGYESIGLWREPVAAVGLDEAARRLADSGLRVSSLCRGGFFTLPEGAERRTAIDENRRAIEETATLAAAGAPGSAAVLVLVAGGIPAGSTDLVGARERVGDALAELAPDAAAAGVTLAIEALHPMYASDRAVVSTLGQALDLAEPFDAAAVGVVVDTFHVWWDPAVFDQIARAGASGRIASYQVCDWATPLPADVLLARHYPGDGVIDFTAFTRAVEAAEYAGDIEVEIFNQAIWDAAWPEVVERTASSFDRVVAPHLSARVGA